MEPFLKQLAHSKSEQATDDGRGKNLSTKENASWCTIECDNKIFQASVVHVGRGRFLIVKDNRNGEYAGKIIDASDIFSCDLGK